MTRCFCHRDLQEGDRQIVVSVAINWGEQDVREDAAKEITFCSYKCLGQYALERALDHDGRVMRESRTLVGVPTGRGQVGLPSPPLDAA